MPGPSRPEFGTENIEMDIMTRGSRDSGKTLAPSTTASRISSPTTGSPATLFTGGDEIGAVMMLAGTKSWVDTLVAVMVAEDIDRKEGWQYSGVLIYDMKIPNTRPRLHPPLIGRIIADHRAVDVIN